ncbi:MAG: Gfo/Idh/MocA family oxidoreductase [Nitrospiraceae bacterium]|nr:Gfo/Idh/MocA family oxidoreductase [Nitrospiraceae bacterium]
MLKVGIIGLGFIGKMHLATFRKAGLGEVVAVADRVPGNLSGDADGGGNIAVDSELASLDGVKLYSNGDALLAESDADVVLIALPTYLHKEFTIKALEADKHVICEKPMAVNAAEGEAMVAAAEKADRLFFVAHCIRFWPAYVKAQELIGEGTYGKVRRAHFSRVSPKPSWSWEGWLLDEAKSGGCLLDLHIHDVDYVNDVFGPPATIAARGIRTGAEGVGDVMVSYEYDNGTLVTIEGSWEQHATFPFRMAFRMTLDKASLEFDSGIDMNLRIHTADGETITPEISSEDGYTQEHRYFFECIESGRKPTRVTPPSSLESLALIERELQSIG